MQTVPNTIYKRSRKSEIKHFQIKIDQVDKYRKTHFIKK